MRPDDVSRAILGALLADPARAESAALDVNRWLDAEPARRGDRGAAWAAARATEVAFAELDAGAASGVSDEVVATFRNLHPPTRVVVALAELCGLDDASVAQATGQPIERVTAVLDSLDAEQSAAAPKTVPTPPPEPDPVPAPPSSGSDAAEASRTDHEPDGGTAEPKSADDHRPLPPPVAAPAFSDAPSARRRDRSDHRSGNRPKDGRTRRSRSRRPGVRRAPRWVLIVAGVIAALIVAGIVINAQKDPGTTDATASASGIGSSAQVRRSTMSEGCSTPAGDAAVPATMTQVEVDGVQRSYRLVAVGPLHPETPRPMLILAGDVGETVDQLVIESRLDQLANALNLVAVVIAPADGVPQWNVTGDSDGPDDMALIDRVIGDQAAKLCVNRSFVLVGGRGVGAHLAGAYACSRPGSVRAAILIAGAWLPKTCSIPTSFSILALLGQDDPILPLDGSRNEAFAGLFGGTPRPGSDYDLQSPTAALDSWARDLGCEGTASQSVGVVTMTINTSCTKGGEIWRVVLPGSGHEWYAASYDLIVQFLTTPPVGGT